MTNPGASTRTQCEINVTPLIDVLLVLLIIFMIITPLAPHGLPAFIPQENTNASAAPAETPIILELRSDHSLRLNSQALSFAALATEIANLYATRANKALFIQADRDLEYRDVAHLIDLVRSATPDLEIGLTKSAT
jgi:biopolymer transport protein ExbD